MTRSCSCTIKWSHGDNTDIVISSQDIKLFILSVVRDCAGYKLAGFANSVVGSAIKKKSPLMTLIDDTQTFNEYDWLLRPVVKHKRLSPDNVQMTVDEALYCVYRSVDFDRPVELLSLYTYLVFITSLCTDLISKGEPGWAQIMADAASVTCPRCVPAVKKARHKIELEECRQSARILNLRIDQRLQHEHLMSYVRNILGLSCVLIASGVLTVVVMKK